VQQYDDEIEGDGEDELGDSSEGSSSSEPNVLPRTNRERESCSGPNVEHHFSGVNLQALLRSRMATAGESEGRVSERIMRSSLPLRSYLRLKMKEVGN
jgi:hypothetical protein